MDRWAVNSYMAEKDATGSEHSPKEFSRTFARPRLAAF